MSLINWGSNNTLDGIERRMTNMMENFWDSARHGRLAERFDVGGGLNPAVEVTESDRAFNVHAELPGVRKEDIHVNVDGNSLTFSGESKHSTESTNENVRYSERRYGAFSRTIPVPENVDKDHIEANFKDGVLELAMPKAKGASGTKKITVR